MIMVKLVLSVVNDPTLSTTPHALPGPQFNRDSVRWLWLVDMSHECDVSLHLTSATNLAHKYLLYFAHVVKTKVIIY